MLLCAEVTKGETDKMPRTLGHADCSWASSASVATLCRAAVSTSKGIAQSAAIIPPCWHPAITSGTELLTARRTVTTPAKACLRYLFRVSDSLLAYGENQKVSADPGSSKGGSTSMSSRENPGSCCDKALSSCSLAA